jgi:hypothetical protein
MAMELVATLSVYALPSFFSRKTASPQEEAALP